tara:strand:- start:300 stop:530 length:231 start_codon:yes stop_codon:yes gene_type:complete
MELGDGIKRATNDEKEKVLNVRKSLVARKGIKKGEKFTEENITAKNPANGILPMLWKDFIGRKASRDFNPDEVIEL